MVVSHNLAAMNSKRQLSIVSSEVSASARKLSSGYRVNIAADDAAGLAISEKMRKQIRGLDKASQNAEEGISLIQTAEGALAEVHDMLQRMNELAIQAANGTNSETDRSYIQDEVNALKTEIDRVATTSKYNEIYLLDGHLADPAKAGEVEKAYGLHMKRADRKIFATELTGANKGGRFSLDDINAQSGLKIIYTEITDEVETQQTGIGSSGLSGGSYETLKDTLETEIVPQAVKALLDTYPETFGYLKDSSIGIGLYLYNDNSNTLASVTLGASASSNGTTLVNAKLSYKLSVNVRTLLSGGAVSLTPDIRDNLEVTIIHEMMHAMMDESLTNGMLGYGGGANFDQSVQFPGWFKEGMAQTAAGGCFDGNDWVNAGGNGWVNGTGGLGIDGNTNEAEIATRITAAGSRLGTDTMTSKYGTGYLACMYLGYLANGGGAVTRDGLKKGVDKLLSSIRGDDATKGKSLNDVIKDITNGKYSGINDFQNKFGDTDSAAFISKLVALAASGTGGLAADFSAESGILPDSQPSPAIRLFKLDPDHDEVTNVYPPDYPVLSGGSATTGGTGTGGTGGTGGPGGPGGPGGTGTPGGAIWAEIELSDGLNLQVTSESGKRMKLYIEAMNCQAIGIGEVDVTTQDKATRSIAMVEFALERVSTQRSLLGAYQNRLEHTVKNLDNVTENTQSAESAIRDTDMADEMVEYSNKNILQQAGQSMLAQTNQSSQGVLTLLR